MPEPADTRSISTSPLNRSADDWSRYVELFHEREAGITERVLTRCRSDGQDPYDWTVDALPASAERIIDIGCGNAPLRNRIGDRSWVGIDRSAAELGLARRSGAQPLVLGDASRLGLRSGVGGAALFSMSLMVATPVADVVAEVARVVGPEGRLVALMPSSRPLTWGDRIAYGRLLVALRQRPRFPEEKVLGDPAAILAAAGMTVVDDHCRRFVYPLDSRTDAELLVDSLYLPRVKPARRAAGSRALARRGRGLGIAFRRIVARPNPAVNR